MAQVRCRRGVALAAAAGTTMFVSGALAQTIVFDNTTTPITGGNWGAMAAGASAANEFGEQVTLAAGPERDIAQFKIWLNSAAGAGTHDMRIRFYTGSASSPPGTVLFDSGPITGVAHVAGANEYTVPVVPNVTVPDTFIWTITLSNRAGSTGAFGPQLYNPPTIGSSTDGFWGFNYLGSGGWESLWFNGPTTGFIANFRSQFSANVTVTGACCLPTGLCEQRSQVSCQNSAGEYAGNNTSCGACNTGRCCLADGSCIITTQAGCTTNAGTYGGNGSACTAACPPPPPVLFNNGDPAAPAEPVGTIITGTTTASGVPAIPGDSWSELQVNAGGTCANTITGFGHSGAIRLADDITVPAPGWNIQQVVLYPIIPNGDPLVSNITSANLRIWNGPPNNPSSTVVFGDTTTNRLHSAHFTKIWRIGATVPPANIAPALTRPVYRVAINVNHTLGPGTYWLDYNLGGATSFNVPVTLVGAQQAPVSNALQFFNSAWQSLLDTGNPANCQSLAQDTSFLVLGTVGAPPAGCYANCDNSTQPPVLNVQDFSCFLTRYAGGESYANCDGSTQQPVLNVQDFSCFLTKYAAGCP